MLNTIVPQIKRPTEHSNKAYKASNDGKKINSNATTNAQMIIIAFFRRAILSSILLYQAYYLIESKNLLYLIP